MKIEELELYDFFGLFEDLDLLDFFKSATQHQNSFEWDLYNGVHFSLYDDFVIVATPGLATRSSIYKKLITRPRFEVELSALWCFVVRKVRSKDQE